MNRAMTNSEPPFSNSPTPSDSLLRILNNKLNMKLVFFMKLLDI